jgi:phosphoserine phosphatase
MNAYLRSKSMRVASAVLNKYGKRTKAAQELESVMWDVILADGCPRQLIHYARAVVAAHKAKQHKRWVASAA